MLKAIICAGALLLASCHREAAAPEPQTQAEEAAGGPSTDVRLPEDAPPPQEQAEAAEQTAAAEGPAPASCADEIGGQASAALVRRCIAVSPATHPPCNAANPCELIQGEIDRACAMYGADETRPAECAA